MATAAHPGPPTAATPGSVSAKAGALTESVIREMTRLALAHDAINLAQGFPDFPAPDELKRGRRRRHRGRFQSVLDHLGRETAARCHRREIPAHLWAAGRSGARDHRLLRVYRRHDRDRSSRSPIPATRW